MVKRNLSDTNIESYENLPTPEEILEEIPASNDVKDNVAKGRHEIQDILSNKDPRKIIIAGPCSIHDTSEAYEYAEKLVSLQKKVSDKFLIVMRVYFEKPRSSGGWKGLINDPDLDGSFNIEKGIRKAREFLIKVNSLGLPAASEFLDPVVPQYISDLISWSAIGARTVESQTHREMASGLSMPIGLKNSTTGEVKNAINAIKFARNPHGFLGINKKGEISKVQSNGNKSGHLILRGGTEGPNYSEGNIEEVKEELKKKELPESIIIDCSHGNSRKDPKKQPEVFENVIKQVVSSEAGKVVKGLMLESNLEEGKQSLPKNPEDLKNLQKGVSVTDACLGWQETEEIILEGYKKFSY